MSDFEVSLAFQYDIAGVSDKVLMLSSRLFDVVISPF